MTVLATRPRAGVEAVSLGCRLNTVEGEQARAAALAAGLTDAVIVNTCAVTAEAVRQSRQALRRARRERPGARLIATGCAVALEPESFAPFADVLLGQAAKLTPAGYGGAAAAPALATPAPATPAPVTPAMGRVRAHLPVQTGCDHRCTFCIIPYARGASRSEPLGAVVAQARALAEAGVAEVVLTGVDLTSYGADLPGAPSLGRLVRAVLRGAPELKRLRLSSIDAAEIDGELLRCFAEEARLAPYLHLSLQHGDDLILKRMKRRHSRADALRLVADVRAVRPDTAFGADLIAGFPTETEAAHAANLSLAAEAGLSFLHVFPFSPRPGTPAARMPQQPPGLARARAAELRSEAAAALRRHLDAQVGRVVEAVVEHGGRGHAGDFTPLVLPGALSPGALTSVRITGDDGARATAAPL